jgi:hypothetical protein
MSPIDKIVSENAGDPKAQRAALAELQRVESARRDQAQANVIAIGGMLEYLDAIIGAEKAEA